jgi:uncharacterized protein
MKIEDPRLRLHIVDSLLEAGADTKYDTHAHSVILSVIMISLTKARFRIRDKNGDTAIDLIPKTDAKLAALVRKSQAHASISNGDIANGMFYCVRSISCIPPY